MYDESTRKRFFAKVQVHENGCHMWTAGKFDTGYGAFQVGGRAKGAHRVAVELAYGAIPEGKLICHRCDTPGCVNVEHLFQGTPADNSSDMASKGRAARGVKNTNAKMTPAKVREIRALYKTGEFYQKDLALRYDVTQSIISKIIRGWSWKHVQ